MPHEDSERLSRELRAIINSHHALVESTSEQQLLDEVCRLICSEVQYRMAWVGYKVEDCDQSIAPMAHAGHESGYLSKINISWAENERGRSPMGAAIRTGKVVHVEDFSSDESVALWSELAAERGYRSVVAIPLLDNEGCVFGGLAVYRDHTGTFSADEVGLLRQLGRDLAFGIGVLRQRDLLRKSDSMFRAAFETSPDSMTISRLSDGAYIDVNPGFTAVFGWSRNEVLGNNSVELHIWRSAAERQEYVDDLRRTGALRGRRYTLHRKDGTAIVAEISSSTFQMDGVEYVLSSVRDVTDEDAARQALQASEERFAQISQASHDFIWEIDAQGVCVFVSPMVTEILGYQPEELVGRSIFDLMDPGEALNSRAQFKYMKDSGVDYHNYVETIRHKNGHQVVLESAVVPVRGDDGTVHGFRGSDRDITERTETERLIRESNELLAQSQRIAKLGHYVFDAKTGLWRSSDALDEIFGITADFVRDIDGWLNLVHPEDRAFMGAYLREHVLREGKPFDRTYRVVRDSDGATRFVHGMGKLERDSSGNVLRMFGVIQDITEAEQAAQELRQSEQRYRSISQSVTSFVYSCLGTTGGDCQLDWMAGAVEQLTGYSSEYIIARKCWRFLVVPEDLPLFEDRVLAVLPGTGATAEFRLVDANGKVYWVRSSVNAVWEDEEAGIIRRVGSIEDITESRKAKDDLIATNIRLERVLKSITETMGKVVEARDPYTQGHEQGVASLCRQIGERMGLSPKEIETIEIAALVHDIGKLAVPTEILSKPTKLTDLELKLIKEHSRAGYEILSSVDYGMPIAEIVLQHHERMDGTGYPNHLKGDEIMLEARVIAVADVIDAMASHRPYRPALGIEAAMREITGTPGAFDPQVVAAAVELYEHGELRLSY